MAVLHLNPLSITACTGRLRPKRVPFFSLRVYERVGILLSEVYEGVRKSVVWASGLTDEFYTVIKSRNVLFL